MSVTYGHQRAFRVLAGTVRDQADLVRSEVAHEIMHGLAHALDGAADQMQQDDVAASDQLDRRHSSVTYDPKAKR